MISYRKLAMRILGRPLTFLGGGVYKTRPLPQRAAALALTAALLTGAAFPAFADTYYIEDGSITISAGTEAGTNKVEQTGRDTVDNDKGTVISSRENTASRNTVTINAEKDVEVTLKDVNIDGRSQNKAAVSVTGSGNTTIELDGSNTLNSGSGHAGLEHNKTDTNGKLTIQDDNDNAGSLDATGGLGGAGIGGGMNKDGQVTITGGNITATGGSYGAGIGGGFKGSGDVTISGGEIHANGGSYGAGIGGGFKGSGDVTISGGEIHANGDTYGAGVGGGTFGLGDVTIEGNTKVNATGGTGGAAIGGGAGAKNNSDNNGNQITIKGNENGSPTVNAVGGGTDETEEIVIGGAGIGAGCKSNADTDITLEGKVTITATAGKDNVAIGANGIELDLDTIKEKLDPGAKVTTTDANGETKQVTGSVKPKPPVTPVEPEKPVIPEESSSSSDGGSATPSAPASPLPGLTVTDKSGAVISYTSTQSGNTLTVCVGRFTASFRISLAALRQLRAEGIETITFQTILCSTTFSVEALLAMGGEDAPVTLAHSMGTARLTVGGADHSELLK